MSDSDNNLKLNIELGVKGEDKAKALHEVLEILAKESGPDAAAALELIGAATGGELMFGVMAAKQLVEAINQAQAASDNMAKAMASNSFAAGMVAMKKVADETAISLQKFADARALLAGHEVTIAQALASQLATMRALSAAQEESAGAQVELDNARRDQAAAMGQMTPDQKNSADAAAAVQAAKDEAARKKNEIDAEIAAKEKAGKDMAAAQPNLDKKYYDAQDAAESAASQASRLAEDFGYGKTNQEFSEWRDKQIESLTGYANNDATQDDRSKLAALKDQQKKEMFVDPDMDERVEALESKLQSYDNYTNLYNHGRSQYLASQSQNAVRQRQKLEDDVGHAHDAAGQNATKAEINRRDIEQAKVDGDAAKLSIDSELSARIQTIISESVTKLSTAGKRELTGEFGFEALTADSLAKKVEGGTANSTQTANLEAFARAFAPNPESIKSAQDAARWVEQNYGSNQQIFDAIQRILHLSEKAGSITDAQLKDINGRINNLAQLIDSKG